MIIQRDGKDYELTENELRQAYKEQEHIYDVEYVKGSIESYTKNDFKLAYELEYDIALDNADNIAYEMRRKIGKYEYDDYYARDEAIYDFGKEFKKNNGK